MKRLPTIYCILFVVRVTLGWRSNTYCSLSKIEEEDDDIIILKTQDHSMAGVVVLTRFDQPEVEVLQRFIFIMVPWDRTGLKSTFLCQHIQVLVERVKPGFPFFWPRKCSMCISTAQAGA